MISVIGTVVILHGYPFFEHLLYVDNSENVSNGSETITTTTTTILRPFFRDHPGEPVPEENFWTLWCKGRLTEADTPTIRMGATPSGLVTSAHLHHPHIFYRPDALPAAQPTASKHRRQLTIIKFTDISNCNQNNNVTQTEVICSYINSSGMNYRDHVNTLQRTYRRQAFARV